MDKFGFLKVASASPKIKLGSPMENATRIAFLADAAARKGAEVMLFPELCLTGATCGDLFLQPSLLEAVKEALVFLAKESRRLPLAMIVGAPLDFHSSIYNTAVVIAEGSIWGIVPQSHPTDHRGMFPSRIFSSGEDVAEQKLMIDEDEIPFGSNLIFNINGVETGIEVGSDIFSLTPPSALLAANGAKLILNPAANCDGAGLRDKIRQCISSQSRRTITAYLHVSAGEGESSTDQVFSGDGFIVERGHILREGRSHEEEDGILLTDIDLERICFERRRNRHFRLMEQRCASMGEYSTIEVEVSEGVHAAALDRDIDPTPFIPHKKEERMMRCEEIFSIQARGLKQRLEHTNAQTAVIGISGGLDSTLALLVCCEAFDLMQKEREQIIAVTMPGFGTTGRTYDNALKLMHGLGVTVREIPIKKACEQHFSDIGLATDDHSAAYENGQARERTQILMDIANMENGLVIGTGDLSELALGWATYNGDQMSMYGVNASIPKTLVRELVLWAAERECDKAIQLTLKDVVDTPVSPELLPSDEKGQIAQKTEDLVGPYELHDFFLYAFLRCGYRPTKILFLAEQAFHPTYNKEVILHWLRCFFRRFFSQQFKRSALPDGASTGSISLSPRADFMMPSDMNVTAWKDELDFL